MGADYPPELTKRANLPGNATFAGSQAPDAKRRVERGNMLSLVYRLIVSVAAWGLDIPSARR